MLQILDIPKNEAEIGDWLEGLLVSRDFGNIVSQLAFLNSSMAEEATDSSDANAITEEQKQAIVEKGVSQLDGAQCSRLLKSPELLIELNERIFETGSTYWMRRIEPTVEEAQFLKRSAASLFGEEPLASDNSVQSNLAKRSGNAVASGGGGVSRRQLLAIAASILAVLCGAYLFQNGGPASTQPWGWQSASAMPVSVPADAYLKSLSDSAEEWFGQNSGSAELLVTNLQAISTGCQRLIDAPHQPLPLEQREWLIEKCQLWKKDIDQLLGDAKSINGDRSKLTVVKNAADDLVSKIALALANKSEEV